MRYPERHLPIWRGRRQLYMANDNLPRGVMKVIDPKDSQAVFVTPQNEGIESVEQQSTWEKIWDSIRSTFTWK